MQTTLACFTVHYWTRWGENLYFAYRQSGDPSAVASELPMRAAGDGFWQLELPVPATPQVIQYRYLVRGARGACRQEPAFRELAVTAATVAVRDEWFVPELPDGAFLRQAFAGIIFNPGRAPEDLAPPAVPPVFRVTLRAPRVPRGCRVCLSGNHRWFGDWDPSRALVLSGTGYPLWAVDLPAAEFTTPVEFKFGLWSEAAGRLVQFEGGGNRLLVRPSEVAEVEVVNCEHFRHATLWKGAGVAVPVFSLRSALGYGIGEFRDLAGLATWAAGCGLQMVQLLPVNDTSSDLTWQDSYPYKAISTAALHPIYLNLDAVFEECGVRLPADYDARRTALNRLPQVDYETVLKDKLAWLRGLFERVRTAALAAGEFRQYLGEQAGWLRPYAAFCRLRDRHRTADFTRWGPDAAFTRAGIDGWFEAGTPEHDEVMFHCWVQFHLERQLTAALAAGHALGVAFKGDLPIGIDRASVEAWTEPELFRMDRQTGAPPDAFAVLGQNWGFPTYDWPRMERDGYTWWRRRLRRMSAVFDALRIDHILGFFRIWEIPQPHPDGILGHYNPTLPLTPEEIRAAGFARDPQAFAEGAAVEGTLAGLFGEAAGPVAAGLLECGRDGFFRLRPGLATEEARRAWYSSAGLEAQAATIEEGVRRLGFEVLFLEDPDHPGRFHPRINLADTAIFQALPVAEQAVLRNLHDDFFHRRHTQFWADEAMKKLPALMDASPMLICGEDLGLVPDSVPVVLSRLGLLSLEVQRWPKRLGQVFGDPADYPYMSVSTTSTHDMSTIRGWWEEEPEARQRFWTTVMHRDGDAPAACAPEICRFVVEQNLAGASMWCIPPLQDWLGIDPQSRHPDAAAERINVPAIPRFYWRYRMHLPLEELAGASAFNRQVAGLVVASGRAPES